MSLYIYIRKTVYDFVNKIIPKKNSPYQTGSVLIVKTDDIGDYVLWRNFLPIIKNSDRYKHSKITFCGNSAWKNLFDNFDKEYVDDVIWLDRKKFKFNIIYRFTFLMKIKRRGFETVINTIYSRSIYIDDTIVLATKAKYKIGSLSNFTNIREEEIGYDKDLYTQKIALPLDNYFDFYRNYDFTKQLLNSQFDIPTFGFPREKQHRLSSLPEKYFVVFPGSRSPLKIWHTSNFIAIADYLSLNYGMTAVVCGAGSDKQYADEFIKAYKYEYIDLVNKKSLSDFLSILQFAQCIISIDTGAVHLAAAVGCPVFGIFNGSHYGRFSPYPKELVTNFYPIYPDAFLDTLDNNAFKNDIIGIDYNSVDIDKVKKTISSFFDK